MSLIQSALEKAGKGHPGRISLDDFIKKPTEKLPSPQTPSPKEMGETSRRKSRCGYFLSAAIVLGIGCLVFYLWKPWTAVSPRKAGEWKPKVVESTMSYFSSTFDSGPRFILNGITTVDGDQFAVINDRVYGVGDELEPKIRVRNIQGRKVTLDIDGQEQVLALEF